MTVQRFTNSARTVLTAPIGGNGLTDRTLLVDSFAAFPAGVQFTVRVGRELMLVTGGAGTGTWTVDRGSEGTDVVPHGTGAPVALVLTAGVMNILAVLTADQGANTVLAGPAIAGAAAPGFRALVTGDLPNAGVTDAKLRTSAAASVIGRAGATGGAPADIAAGADGDVLRRAAGALAFGQVATAGVADNAVTYAKMQDLSATQRVLGRNSAGAGDAQELTLSQVLDWVGSAAHGDLLYRAASGWTRLPAGSAGQVLQTQGPGTNPLWATPALLRGYIDGLTMSRPSATTVAVAGGVARSTDDTFTLTLTSTVTKTLQSSGAWAAGSGNNGLDTGARANSTWYHVWVISQASGGSPDVLLSTSATSPTMPSGYTLKRRIGSVRTDGSGNLIDFVQRPGGEFRWVTPALDVIVNNPGTSAVTRTLTVPTGVRVKALMRVGFSASSQADNPSAIVVSDLSTADVSPNAAIADVLCYSASVTINNVLMPLECWTNTSAQVRSRQQLSASSTSIFEILTIGWTDPRGTNE